MLSINIVCVGALKERFWIEACEEYSKRLSRFCKLKIIELEDLSGEDIDRVLDREGEEILKNLGKNNFLLAIEGKEYSSQDFAKLLRDQSQISSELTFVIGSSYGVSQDVKSKISNKISLGKPTYPHNIARILILEQIYRGFMINSGSSYHK